MASIEELLKKHKKNQAIAARSKKAESPNLDSEEEPKLPTTAEIIQLPLWRDFERAAPSCVLRSALFGVVKRGRRKYLESEQLAAWGKDSLSYTGMRLDQSDLDVWLEMLHVCRETQLGQTVEFEKYTMLKQLGRATGKANWKWLETSIKRMIACCVEIKSGSYRYLGNLIENGYIDDKTGRYVVVLNQNMVNLFKSGYTLQHAQKRRLLKTDLSKWLAGYLESHKATPESPHRAKLETLHSLCGSENKDARDFRRKIKQAAEALKEQNIIRYWKLEKDVLEVAK